MSNATAVVGGMEGVVAAIEGAERITAVCHENPDADTVAGAIAIALMGERLGKQTEIVSVDRPGPAYDFLPRIGDVRRSPELTPDLAVICDAANIERVGRILDEQADWFGRARIVNVDHHISNTAYGDANLVDPSASATCEVLADLADSLGVAIDAELATALLTGVVRDSNGFADPSTTPRTLRLAARLVEAGAPLATVYRRIHHEMPVGAMSLWGHLLHAMESHLDGRVVITILTPGMLDATGTQQHDADGVAEFMAKGHGVEVAILLRALGPDETRVSVRTSPAVDAIRLLAPFGGGGHARRAGATILRPAEEAARDLLAVCGEVLAPTP